MRASNLMGPEPSAIARRNLKQEIRRKCSHVERTKPLVDLNRMGRKWKLDVAHCLKPSVLPDNVLSVLPPLAASIDALRYIGSSAFAIHHNQIAKIAKPMEIFMARSGDCAWKTDTSATLAKESIQTSNAKDVIILSARPADDNISWSEADPIKAG